MLFKIKKFYCIIFHNHKYMNYTAIIKPKLWLYGKCSKCGFGFNLTVHENSFINLIEKR